MLPIAACLFRARSTVVRYCGRLLNRNVHVQTEQMSRAPYLTFTSVNQDLVKFFGTIGRRGGSCEPLSPMEGTMRWYSYVAYFFGGVFLVNAVPHFVNGVSGRLFPTPFASPPGKGQSSPTVNVLWGTLNAVGGYFLVCHVGEFHIRQIPDVLVPGAGGLLMAVMLSRLFGRFSKGSNGTK
jgi:hypothetical protein